MKSECCECGNPRSAVQHAATIASPIMCPPNTLRAGVRTVCREPGSRRAARVKDGKQVDYAFLDSSYFGLSAPFRCYNTAMIQKILKVRVRLSIRPKNNGSVMLRQILPPTLMEHGSPQEKVGAQAIQTCKQSAACKERAI